MQIKHIDFENFETHKYWLREFSFNLELLLLLLLLLVLLLLLLSQLANKNR